MPSYAEMIARRDARRASVCPRHGPIRDRRRCRRSRACTLAQRMAEQLREPETSPQIAPEPQGEPGQRVTAAQLAAGCLLSVEQAREALMPVGRAVAAVFGDWITDYGYREPQVETRRVDERVSVRYGMTGEMITRVGIGPVIRHLIDGMLCRLAEMIVERYVPEPGRLRLHVTRADIDDRGTPMPSYFGPARIEGTTEDGRRVAVDLDGRIAQDQDFLTDTWVVMLSSTNATVTWDSHAVTTYAATTAGTGYRVEPVHYTNATTTAYSRVAEPVTYRHPLVRAPVKTMLTLPESTPEEIEAERVARAQRLAERRRVEAELTEQRAANERRRIEIERAEETRRRAERAAADERADALLRSLLTADQIAQMEREREITVRGSEGTTFRLEIGHYDGNVRWFDQAGREQGRMCAHPRVWDGEGTLPRSDIIAGQVLALQTDERSFVDIANLFEGYKPNYGPRVGPEPNAATNARPVVIAA